MVIPTTPSRGSLKDAPLTAAMVPPLRGATIGPDARWVDGREARPINPDRTDANAPLIRPIEAVE